MIYEFIFLKINRFKEIGGKKLYSRLLGFDEMDTIKKKTLRLKKFYSKIRIFLLHIRTITS